MSKFTNKFLVLLLIISQFANATIVKPVHPGGGGGAAAWGSITGTLSDQTDLNSALGAKMGVSAGCLDNIVMRSDGTGGYTVQDSPLSISDLSSNAFSVSTASATTSTAVTLKAGDNSSTSAGGALYLRGGSDGTGANRGDVIIYGTANSTGNRATFGVYTDGVGELGYCYGLGAYCRFRAAFFKSGVEIRESGGSGSGFNIFQDGTDSQLRMYRSTSGHGVWLQNTGNIKLVVTDESSNINFQFGGGSGSSDMGAFYMAKSSGANLLWTTDGGGRIGGSASTRPNEIYVKTSMNYGQVDETSGQGGGMTFDKSGFIGPCMKMLPSNSSGNGVKFCLEAAKTVVMFDSGGTELMRFGPNFVRLVGISTTTRDALTALDGMMVYNSTDTKFQGRAGGAWVDFH